MLSKQEAAAEIRAAKVRLGLSWARLAEAVGEPVPCLTRRAPAMPAN